MKNREKDKPEMGKKKAQLRKREKERTDECRGRERERL